jgi:hypothetical protein
MAGTQVDGGDPVCHAYPVGQHARRIGSLAFALDRDEITVARYRAALARGSLTFVSQAALDGGVGGRVF